MKETILIEWLLLKLVIAENKVNLLKNQVLVGRLQI